MNHALAPLALALSLLAGATAAQAQDAKPGDAARGGARAQMCIGCHGITGYQASFPEVYKVPMIAGQSAVYIKSALLAYQKGDRKHPTMRGIAASLTEQDMADLGAYYEAQGKGIGQPAPAQLAQALPDALKDRMAICVTCHGANLSAPIDPSYPKLAGQHADYLYASLRSYAVDGNPYIGRNNASMRGQVVHEGADKKLKAVFTHAELRDLSRYIASLPSDLHTVPEPRMRR